MTAQRRMQTTIMNTKVRRTAIRCPTGQERPSSHVKSSWFEDNGSSTLPFTDCLPPVDTADVWHTLSKVTHRSQGDTCPYSYRGFWSGQRTRSRATCRWSQSQRLGTNSVVYSLILSFVTANLSSEVLSTGQRQSASIFSVWGQEKRSAHLLGEDAREDKS